MNLLKQLDDVHKKHVLNHGGMKDAESILSIFRESVGLQEPQEQPTNVVSFLPEPEPTTPEIDWAIDHNANTQASMQEERAKKEMDESKVLQYALKQTEKLINALLDEVEGDSPVTMEVAQAQLVSLLESEVKPKVINKLKTKEA